MTRDNKNDYLRLALGFQNIGVTNQMADRIIETYEKMLVLKDSFTIKDAVEISVSMDRKYKKKELKGK